MKQKLFYIWIEGLDPRSGEKIKRIKNGRAEYTLLITEAMRVKQNHIGLMKNILKDCGIADWCINSHNTFVRTNYAPKNTIFKP